MHVIKTVDVASYQHPLSQETLGSWIANGAQGLIIRAYQTFEQVGLQDCTRQQTKAALQAGIWFWYYVWLYMGINPVASVRNALDLIWSLGVQPKLLALDCETYEGEEGPSIAQVISASNECIRQGVVPIIYTGNWWLDLKAKRGDDVVLLRGHDAWLSDYDDPSQLNIDNRYGLHIVGHQYTSDPVDWSYFDLDELIRLVDPCATLRRQVSRAIGRRYLNRRVLKRLVS